MCYSYAYGSSVPTTLDEYLDQEFEKWALRDWDDFECAEVSLVFTRELASHLGCSDDGFVSDLLVFERDQTNVEIVPGSDYRRGLTLDFLNADPYDYAMYDMAKLSGYLYPETAPAPSLRSWCDRYLPLTGVVAGQGRFGATGYHTGFVERARAALGRPVRTVASQQLCRRH